MKLILFLTLAGLALCSQKITFGGKKLKGSICDGCVITAEQMKILIEDKNMQNNIRDFIDKKLCNRLGSYSGFCDVFVAETLPEFFQEVEHLLKEPKDFCSELHLCSGESVGIRNIMRHVLENTLLHRAIFNTPNTTCEECETFVVGLKTYFDDKSHQQMIRTDFINFFCSHLKTQYRFDRCTELLEITLAEFISIVDELLANPKTACQYIQMCP